MNSSVKKLREVFRPTMTKCPRGTKFENYDFDNFTTDDLTTFATSRLVIDL
jgi:hypothetical protein